MRSFRSSLERQIMESIYIDDEDPEVRLNSRSEWGANKVPRLIIDPDSRYKPGEQDQNNDQSQEEQEGQGQTSEQRQENGKRSRPEATKEQVKVRSGNEIPNEEQCSSTGKKIRLNITDHFRPTVRGNPARNK